jgi:hypothetical protein
MKMTYILQSPSIVGQLEFTYDESGVLLSFLNATLAPMSDAQLKFLQTEFPVTLTQLEFIAGTSKTMTITMVPPDLGFDTFWEMFAYKIGNKTACKKAWDELSPADRTIALDRIPGYNYYLVLKPTIQRMYPLTYLIERRFETDYKALAKATTKSS